MRDAEKLCAGGVRPTSKSYHSRIYQPETAYFECIHQVKLIVDLLYEHGLAGMYRRISDTAEFGAYLAGPRVVHRHVQGSLRAVLEDI